jgi:serine/threonine protein kinase
LANGLRQIHELSIAHQDIKPSNVVSTAGNITKLTDFGSAAPLNGDERALPDHIKQSISGTWAYAPPELLYDEINSNPIVRRIGCDLYLLGSMVVFYFTRSNMTALIRANLADNVSWTNRDTRGRYNEVKSYLTMAFEQALADLGNFIPEEKIREKVILTVKYLCNPDPELRGHAKTIKELGSNFSLHRFVTMFDVLAREYEIKGK